MSKSNDQFETPILMLVFNRPELTEVVLKRVLEQCPIKLYVVADGPRSHNADDQIKCAQTRNLFKIIPENTTLYTLFRSENLGCKNSVSSGISWFFSHEEKGIILEDDCLPNVSFFQFSKELLDKYENDSKVMHIGGNNFQFGKKRGFSEGADYYFSNLSHIWGWATWRRTWELYNMEMQGLDEFKSQSTLKKLGWEWFFAKKYYKHFRQVKNNQIDTWDYQYHFTILQRHGLSIIPNVNLVENIGFGKHATHTKDEHSIMSRIPTESIQFPLKHPDDFTADIEADNFTLSLIYGKNWWERGIRFLKTFLKR